MCVCVYCAEAKAAGISDILSFKDSLCPTGDDGESCSKLYICHYHDLCHVTETLHAFNYVAEILVQINGFF